MVVVLVVIVMLGMFGMLGQYLASHSVHCHFHSLTLAEYLYVVHQAFLTAVLSISLNGCAIGMLFCNGDGLGQRDCGCRHGRFFVTM